MFFVSQRSTCIKKDTGVVLSGFKTNFLKFHFKKIIEDKKNCRSIEISADDN